MVHRNGELYCLCRIFNINIVFIFVFFFVESVIKNIEEDPEIQHSLLEKETQIHDVFYKLNESSDNVNSNAASSWHVFYHEQYLYILLYMYLLSLLVFFTQNGSYLLYELNLKQNGVWHSMFGRKRGI